MWLIASLWAGLLSCWKFQQASSFIGWQFACPLEEGIFITIPYSSEVIFQSAWPFLLWNRVLRLLVPDTSCARVMPYGLIPAYILVVLEWSTWDAMCPSDPLSHLTMALIASMIQ